MNEEKDSMGGGEAGKSAMEGAATPEASAAGNRRRRSAFSNSRPSSPISRIAACGPLPMPKTRGAARSAR